MKGLHVTEMNNIIEKEYIVCGSCGLKFDRTKEYKHCSNCFACTGCEIYYCPQCDNEIVITPVRPMNYSSKADKKAKNLNHHHKKK